MKITETFQEIAPGPHTSMLPLGWFAINHSWIKDKSDRRTAFDKVYKISSKHGTIYRNIRFLPKLKGIKKNKENEVTQTPQIMIDWSGWITLTDVDNEKKNVELTITKANPIALFYHADSHPDPAYRHSMFIARIGLYLGIISLILAFK